MRRAATATGAPVLVTENGIAADDDTRRVEFVRQALHSVLDCLDDGLDVRGSTYWSLLDTFEWAHGYRPTFGLVAVDRTTQVRTPQAQCALIDRRRYSAASCIDVHRYQERCGCRTPRRPARPPRRRAARRWGRRRCQM